MDRERSCSMSSEDASAQSRPQLQGTMPTGQSRDFMHGSIMTGSSILRRVA